MLLRERPSSSRAGAPSGGARRSSEVREDDWERRLLCVGSALRAPPSWPKEAETRASRGPPSLPVSTGRWLDPRRSPVSQEAQVVVSSARVVAGDRSGSMPRRPEPPSRAGSRPSERRSARSGHREHGSGRPVPSCCRCSRAGGPRRAVSASGGPMRVGAEARAMRPALRADSAVAHGAGAPRQASREGAP